MATTAKANKKPKPKAASKVASKAPRKRAKPAAKPAKKAAKAGVKKGPLSSMSSPVQHPKQPERYRARVRMYRHGLGDCFLLTIPRKAREPAFQMLIDCGALSRDKTFMQGVVRHIRDTIQVDGAKARLDVVVGTHEHKDHLSGFNQAREIWNNDFDFGAVWLAWTENISQAEIKRIKETKKRIAAKLRSVALAPRFAGRLDDFEGLSALTAFSADDDSTDSRTVEQALAYLKARGEDAGDLKYLEPGQVVPLDGVKDVRAYVLGPPQDPRWLKTSAVTEQMKRDHVIYHIDGRAEVGLDALDAALDGAGSSEQSCGHPFAPEHRLRKGNPGFQAVSPLLDKTYDAASEKWRRVDSDWIGAFEQLALDLDNDTNNTSLVLAFEFGSGGPVLLFVADAQIGSWLSWKELRFKRSGGSPLTAADLLARTNFYKVGHHCSHNATAQADGLELMTDPDLVAFIPLDEATARGMGKSGWDMPAEPLFRALERMTEGRVFVSDVVRDLPTKKAEGRVLATDDYIDYFLL